MKILHTSDWHLGRTLYGRKRYEEFGLFLRWLRDFIGDNEIDALLVAGDVFDTTTPPNKAQELYYEFLGSLSTTSCRNVVITGGNHDSPSFLNAPGCLYAIRRSQRNSNLHCRFLPLKSLLTRSLNSGMNQETLRQLFVPYPIFVTGMFERLQPMNQWKTSTGIFSQA